MLLTSNLLSRLRSDPASRRIRGGILLAACLALTACHRDEIASYEAPKDAPPPPPPSAAQNPHGAHGAHGGMGMEGMPPRPGLRWKALPDGWTSRGPSGMRAANFTLASEAGGAADLAVIPLPGTGGSDLELVNLWRGQLSLPPITAAELPAQTEETTIGQQRVKLFSIVGTGAADASAAADQILVAALQREGFTWFFKLSGDAATVRSHRDRLQAFLADVEFTEPEATPPPRMASTAAASPSAPSSPSGPATSGAGQPQWVVPDSWKSQPATSMIHSKWTVSTAEGTSADITVSVFPGSTGGMIPNLNRWRAQVGLQPASEADLTPFIDNTDVLGGKATLVDFTGTNPEDGVPKRMVGAIVERGGQFWFYKLLGAPAAVEVGREGFVRFVQSVQYPRGS